MLGPSRQGTLSLEGGACWPLPSPSAWDLLPCFLFLSPLLRLTLSLTCSFTVLLFSLSLLFSLQKEMPHNAVLKFRNAQLLRAQETLRLRRAGFLGAGRWAQRPAAPVIPHPL